MIPLSRLNSHLFSSQKMTFWIGVSLFLIICGKFYHLFGVDQYKQPVAPMPIILLRDVFTISFLCVFGFLNRKTLAYSKLFWTLWTTGFAVSLMQLIGPKDFMTWGQHYLRNLLIPLLFYPVALSLFKKDIQVPLKPVLLWVFIANVLISYAQLAFSEGPTRPAGVFADPIVNSMVLFWGLVAIGFEKGKVSFFIASLALIPLLQYLSSLTAILSAVLGVLTAIFSVRQELFQYVRSHFKKLALTMTVGAFCLFSLAWLTQMKNQNSADFASGKIKALYESISCSQEGCQHRSYSGRVISNLRPYTLCKESLSSCFIGNIQTDAYERLESTVGSLVANWGIVFCFLYIFWIGQHFALSFQIKDNLNPYDKNLLFWKIVFFSGLYFSIFNTMPYRLPINIIIYISLAYMMSRKTKSLNNI